MKRKILLTVVLILILNSSFIFPQSNWFWQNPSTCGWGALDVSFANPNTGWIVSYFGTVMKSTNGGANFYDQNINFDGTLLGVNFFDVNTGYVFGAGGVFFKTTNSGINWVQIPNSIGQYLSDCHFFDVNTGWICGYNGTIVKTTSGGMNWTSYTSGVTSILNSIHFLDNNNGIVGGWTNALLKTTNGGQNWLSIAPTGNSTFSSVYYASFDTIYAGTSGYIFRSTNGGLNWTTQTTPAIINVGSFKFYGNAKNGIAVGSGGTGTYVLKTTNGGELWTTLHSGPNSQSIKASYFDTTHIICAGPKTTGGVLSFFTTTNSGINWNNYSSLYYFSQISTSIYFLNQNKGFISGGYNGTQMTTDGGTTWALAPINMNSYYYDIKFYNDNTGLIVGDNRSIARTTNGGYNWENVNMELGNKRLHELSLPSYPVGYAFGEELIKKTTNGGLNWFNVYTSANIYGGGYFINDNTGWTFYSGTILKTTNGGTSWTTLFSGGGSFTDIYFATLDTGWACGTGGVVGRTTNGGVNWLSVNVGITGTLYDLAFINSTSGFVTGTNGFVSYTTNGGINWYKQTVGMGNKQVFAICFINSMTGWITGYDGYTKKTTNGGYFPTGITPINISIPEKYSLNQNYPNPFNPITRLRFVVAMRSSSVAYRGDNVLLKVFDVMGREVQTLVNERLQPGTYEVSFDGSRLASGIYFYKLISDGFSESKKWYY